MRSIYAVIVALALGNASPGFLQAQTEQDFAGAWELVRTEALDDGGRWVTTTSTFGPDADGVIMYDGTSTMSVQIVRRDRSQDTGSANTVDGYMAYFGRYEVDPANRLVTHRRENHINPGQATAEAVRGFEFEGDRLTLTVEPQRRFRLVWRKRPS